MISSDLYLINGVLRSFVYAGTILAVGSVLFAATFPAQWRSVGGVLRRQIAIGALVIAVVEPLRFALYLLAMAGGDGAVAFGPEMVSLGLEMPAGQASLVRLSGVGLIAVAGLRYSLAGAIGCSAAVVSYALEGHTAGDAVPFWTALALFVHVAAVHWWIGSLWPLGVLVAANPDGGAARVSQIVKRYGRAALVAVALLAAAGAVVLAAIVDWRPDPTSPYQQLFAAKILAVLVIFALAAFNRFRVTPLIGKDAKAGAFSLRSSIRIEIAVALVILVLTGFVTNTMPRMDH